MIHIRPVRRIRTEPQSPRTTRRIATALAASFTLLVGLTTVPTAVANASTSDGAGLFSDTLKPQATAAASTESTNLGMKFTSKVNGSVAALQFYRSGLQSSAYEASLWDLNGELLSTTTFVASSEEGWQTAALPEPVKVDRGRWYVVSYLATDGGFSYTDDVFPSDWSNGDLTARKQAGTYAAAEFSKIPKTSARGTSFMLDVVFVEKGATWSGSTDSDLTPAPEPTPEPTPEPEPAPTETQEPAPVPEPSDPSEPSVDPAPEPSNPASDDWPNASNTGVPAGVSLTTYTGPMTIRTNGTVIKDKVVNGRLRIQAANVQIINTRINGNIDLRDPKETNYSFSIVDSEVHIGDNLNTGIANGNFKANRVEVTGGRRSMYCEYNCTIENSWVHSQGGDPGGDAHFSGIRMEQYTTLRHNTITCEAQRGSGTGCSAGLTGYGDFAPIQNNLIENNYFHGGGGGGSSMCAYGGSSGANGSKPYGHLAANIRFIDNIFARGENGRCGIHGAISSFDDTRPGNVWQGNTWDDGTTINSNGR